LAYALNSVDDIVEIKDDEFTISNPINLVIYSYQISDAAWVGKLEAKLF